MTETSPTIPGRPAAGSRTSWRPGPIATAWVAAFIFGAMLLQALADPLVSWDARDQWPRAELLPPAAFLTLLIAGLAVQSATVALTRRAPLIGLCASFGVFVTMAIGLDSPNWVQAGSLAIAVSMFFVAERRRLVTTSALLIALLVLLGSMQWVWVSRMSGAPATAWWPYVLNSTMRTFPLIAAGGVFGALWGIQTRRVDAARLDAEAAQREHAQRVARAQQEERERIAQELHDVAAQHLAGLLSLADAATDIFGADPQTAGRLLDEMRSEGRFAAASIYSALGELRSGSASSPPTPTPDVRELAELVDTWRGRGMTVDLVTVGALDAVPPVVSVTAYRVVQEGLANAAKHAPGAAVTVRLLADGEHLTASVENGTARTATVSGEAIGLGWGLSGLQERLALLDGTLTAAANPGGGWRLEAELPLAHRDGPRETRWEG